MLVNCCDTIRGAYDILKAFGNLDFLYLLDILHSQESCSVQHARDQLLDLAEAYGAYKGTQFDRAAFFAAFQPKPQSPGPQSPCWEPRWAPTSSPLVEGDHAPACGKPDLCRQPLGGPAGG